MFPKLQVPLVALLLLSQGCSEDSPAPTPRPAPAPAPAPAPEPAPEPAPVFAAAVTDRASLKAFVDHGVKVTLDGVSEADGLRAFFDRVFRPDDEWRAGDVYLYVLSSEGQTLLHAGNAEIEGQNLSDRTDPNGVHYVRELVAAGIAGGGFVEYWFDNPEVQGDETHGSPKVGYVAPLEIGGETFILGSGFYPRATAAQVTDRESLKTFVDLAHSVALAGVSDEPAGARDFFEAAFAPEGDWRRGAVYLFVADFDGVVFFHAGDRSLEGQDISDLTDANGVRITEGLLEAARAGGGYLEYLFDDPTVEGDEETGSPKVGYAVTMTIGDVPWALGAGFHPKPE